MRVRHFDLVALVITLALLVTSVVVAQEVPTPPASSRPMDGDQVVQQLGQLTGGKAEVAYHAKTGKLRFIGTDLDHPVPKPAAVGGDASPETTARAFLDNYGSAFGVSDQAKALKVKRSRTDENGQSFVHFQQVYQDVPVVGGELIVQLDKNKNLLSASGELLPDIDVSTKPSVSANDAHKIAEEAVASKHNLKGEKLTVSQPELWVYNPALVGDRSPATTGLVWRMEVKPDDLLPIDEFVLVDAQRGAVVLQFNQIDSALFRKIYDNQNNSSYGLPGPNLVRSEGQAPVGLTDANKAYDYAGDTYNFYKNYHNRDSINNAGMQLISTVRYCRPGYTCPYANAFWNGTQMVYGQGYASADDVVAHEMTHGVTDYESNLLYYMQSGAINEAFSDIWGEFVDLTNGKGNDTATVRWLMGEDLSIGAIRSMKNPPTYGDPDKMTSSYWNCDPNGADNGGVHTNSGVANKAAYLMVDGGTFNGKTVSPLGINKTAKVWYKVQADLLTSAGDYANLGSALQQSCTSLVGTNGITSADCVQVKNAVDAVEMSKQPTSCPATEAPVCASGQAVTNVFFDNLENPGAGRWTKAAIVGSNAWYYPQNPNPYWDATYATSGTRNFWGYNLPARSDSYIAMTSAVMIPPGAFLHFNHAYEFQFSGTTYYDGGVVEYSANGGAWTDARTLFVNNGYKGTIYGTSTGNPLGGRQAFVGRSNGYISSRADLASLAGKSVKFRFRIGTNSSGDSYGWFIDDVRIYRCTSGLTNDNISTPKVISSLPYKDNMSTVSATAVSSDPNLPCAGNAKKYRTVWYRYTPTTSGRLIVNTNGSTYDTILAVWRGPTSGLINVGCSNPTGNAAALNVAVTGGTIYYIEVASNTTTGGNLVLNASFQLPSGTWTTVKSENFEGSFPSGWTRMGATYTWGKRTCRPYQGSYSGWCIGDSTGAAPACGSNYPNSQSNWMIYGPFSTVGWTAGDFKMKLWRNTEVTYDKVLVAANTALYGTYWGTAYWNTVNWEDAGINLASIPTYGNLLNKPAVYVAIAFITDSSINKAEGGYVDNIVLRKCTGGPCTGALGEGDNLAQGVPMSAEVTPGLQVR